MRAVFVLLVVLIVAVSARKVQNRAKPHFNPHTKAQNIKVREANFYVGENIPVHVPIQNVTEGPFAVPYWLGVFVSAPDNEVNWTLPLTYGSGGKVMAGQLLFVRNYGQSQINLYPMGQEFIDGQPVFSVTPHAGVQFTAMHTGGYIALSEI